MGMLPYCQGDEFTHHEKETVSMEALPMESPFVSTGHLAATAVAMGGHHIYTVPLLL